MLGIKINQDDDGTFHAAEHDVPDQVVVYRDEDKQWRWRRTTLDNETVADSVDSYPLVRDCLYAATRVNASPYILTVEGDVDSTLQVDLKPGQD